MTATAFIDIELPYDRYSDYHKIGFPTPIIISHSSQAWPDLKTHQEE